MTLGLASLGAREERTMLASSTVLVFKDEPWHKDWHVWTNSVLVGVEFKSHSFFQYELQNRLSRQSNPDSADSLREMNLLSVSLDRAVQIGSPVITIHTALSQSRLSLNRCVVCHAEVHELPGHWSCRGFLLRSPQQDKTLRVESWALSSRQGRRLMTGVPKPESVHAWRMHFASTLHGVGSHLLIRRQGCRTSCNVSKVIQWSLICVCGRGVNKTVDSLTDPIRMREESVCQQAGELICTYNFLLDILSAYRMVDSLFSDHSSYSSTGMSVVHFYLSFLLSIPSAYRMVDGLLGDHSKDCSLDLLSVFNVVFVFVICRLVVFVFERFVCFKSFLVVILFHQHFSLSVVLGFFMFPRSVLPVFYLSFTGVFLLFLSGSTRARTAVGGLAQSESCGLCPLGLNVLFRGGCRLTWTHRAHLGHSRKGALGVGFLSACCVHLTVFLT